MLFQKKETLKRLGNSEELLNEFVQIFREDSPGLLDSMNQALEAGDAKELGEKAHALKGLVSNFGAEEIVALAAELENAEFELNSGKTDNEKTQAGLKRIEEMIKQLDDELTNSIA